MWITRVIDVSLNTDVTPLAYLVTLHSLIFGGSFVAFGWTEAVQALTLFKLGALVGVPVWGALLLTATVILLYALHKKSKSAAIYGGFLGALTWIFALITYVIAGFWLQAILAVITAMYFGYFVLSGTLDRLWNYTPE